MSWSTVQSRISDLMVAGGFSESDTTFNLENLPSSVSDKRFCILVDGYQKTRPGILNPKVVVSVQFGMGDASPVLYSAAIELCEWIIRTIDNANDINFTGSTHKLNNTENYLLCEFTFNIYHI